MFGLSGWGGGGQGVWHRVATQYRFAERLKGRVRALQSLKAPLIKGKGNSKHCWAYYSKASLWANQTGSIYLQVMCTAHPAENVNYVFKGRQGALAVWLSVEGSPREEMLKSLSSQGCQLSVWLWEGKGFLRGSCDVHSAGRELFSLLFRWWLASQVAPCPYLFQCLSLSRLQILSPLGVLHLHILWNLTPSMAPLHFHTQIDPTHIQRQFSDATVNVVMCIVFDSGIPILGMSPPIVIFPQGSKKNTCRLLCHHKN